MPRAGGGADNNVQSWEEVLHMTQAAIVPAHNQEHSLGFGSRGWAVIAITALVASVIGAIWGHHWFVTQDGPIYAYNAGIILQSLKSNNPFQGYYSVHWAPVPYWGAYLLFGAFISIFPERIADHLVVSIVSAGFLGCILWMRHRVAGWDGMALVVPFAGILSMNLLWLLGFYNFLLGSCFYAITLGCWWWWRDNLGLGRAVWLAGLLVLGYLCHPVSSGLTGFALITMAITTPGARAESLPNIARPVRRRLFWTLASLVPLGLLMCYYRSIIPAGAESQPRWTGLANPSSILEWLNYLKGADITEIARTGPNLFFSHTISGLSHLPAVTTWILAGLICLLVSAIWHPRGRKSEAIVAGRGWYVVAAVLITCGLVGPVDLGDSSGGFLRQRILLLGLATAVPIMEFPLKRSGAPSAIARLACAALLVGCIIQVVTVWGYAEESNRMAARFIQAKPFVGSGQRIAVLIVEPESDYEPRPLLHLSDLLGIQTGNVIWNSYAPALYYFPVQFRDPENRTLFYVRGIPDFEQAEITEDELEDWEDLLSEIEEKTDVLVIWGRNPALDEVNSEWFGDEPVFENGNVRVFKHLEPAGSDNAEPDS